MSDPVAPSRPPLAPEALGPDPVIAFSRWLADAEEESRMSYPNAATLSTLTPDGTPDGRIVLVKGVDERGFRFFSNHESAKGRALQEHPRAALTFYWDGMGRQVRVRGGVTRIPAEESDQYFESRPRGSRIGAWASPQSRPLPDRESLETRFHEVEARFRDQEVPRPAHWGGYVLKPDEIEFWQEGRFRLHDRLLYGRDGDTWSVVRLSP